MNTKDALKTIVEDLNLSILFLAVNRRVWPWKWQIEFEHFIAAEILFSSTKMCWHILFSRSFSLSLSWMSLHPSIYIYVILPRFLFFIE